MINFRKLPILTYLSTLFYHKSFGAFIVACFLFVSPVIGQEKISGVVTSNTGIPLFGATIVVVGTTIATTTVADGTFIINAKPGNTLDISFVGYKSRQVKVGIEASFKISLSEAVVSLDEVVVTGYNAQKVKEIAGSVSVVRTKDLVSVPAGQVGPMLQGRAAGLTVISSGEPGAPVTIRLHGQGNFGDVTPLYIIDGVPGDINSINAYDIESTLVLKDAATYSIYGVRGANGVIIVNTKKGRPGKTRISYDGYVGWQQPLEKGLDLLTPIENAEMIWQAMKNSGQVAANGNPDHPMYGNGPTPVLPYYLFAGPNQGLSFTDPLASPTLYNLDPALGSVYQIVPFNQKGTDWFHEMFKPSFSQNHALTISGGSEKNLYLLSLGYLDQEGTLLNTFLKRFSLRLNTNFNYGKAFHIGENIQWSYTENPQSSKSGPSSTYGSSVARALATDPSWPVYDINGAWNPGLTMNPGPDDNPVASQVHSKDNKEKKWDILGNVFASVDFLNSFTAKTSFGGSLSNYYKYAFRYPSYDYPNSGTPNQLAESSGYAYSLTWTNTVEYTKKMANHSIKALVGTEMLSNHSRENGGAASDLAFSDPSYWLLNNGNPLTRTNFSIASISKLYSFISKVDYSFKEKYFLSGTFRRDGSSVFGPENRFGWFPAVAAAWRMSEEKFLQDSKVITELKLRASWGRTGFNGNTDPANQFTLYGGSAADAYYDINGISSGNIQRGNRMVRLGNPKTGWQQDEVINLGLDAILWKGKFSITAELYNKKTKGLLFPISLPALLGDAIPPNVNVGNISNKGIDLTVGSKGKFSKNLQWDVLATFTHYKNRITQLNDIPYFFDNGGLIKNEVGYPISSFFGYQIIGFFADINDINKSPVQPASKPGRFKYADTNHRDSATGKLTGMPDGNIDEADRVHFGNPHPDFTIGLNIGLTYKNFDFSTFLYCSVGNDVWNRSRSLLEVSPFSIGTKTALYDSWTPTHKNARAPVLETSHNFSTNAEINSYGIEDGSYLRNKSLILGYTFSSKSLAKIKFERLRVYAQVVNLFTITRYTGLDPELSRSNGIQLNQPGFSNSFFGIDHSNYPGNQKQFLVGINLGI